MSDAAYCVLFSFNSNFSLTLSNKLKRLYFLTTPHVINIKKNHFLIFSLYICINNNTNHLFRVHLSDKVYVVIFLVYLLLFCRWCCHNNISLRNTYVPKSVKLPLTLINKLIQTSKYQSWFDFTSTSWYKPGWTKECTYHSFSLAYTRLISPPWYKLTNFTLDLR